MKKKSINNSNKIIINILILVIAVFSVASIDTMSTGATIAYIGDAEPANSYDVKELTKDLTQVIPLSPTGKVDAIFFMGDMTKLSRTLQAVAASNVKNVPVYFVIGNHEAQSSSEVALIQGRYLTSKFQLNPGPAGTDKTTYSMNIGNIHVINVNEYWNGAADDSYLKYSSSNGGYVPKALYKWMETDLSKTSNWKIVVGHEPFYPKKRGNSLDADKANRDKLQALFVSKNVDLFISGHIHIAGVQNEGGVYHANTGVIGSHASGSGDGVASISYTYTTANNLILTIKQENPTWGTPRTISKVISPNLINGTVMDSVSKSGLAGVKVFTNTSLSTTTNATGFYSFAVSKGTYNLTARLEPMYYINTTTVSTIEKAVVIWDIELLKKPTGNITGSVTG